MLGRRIVAARVRRQDPVLDGDPEQILTRHEAQARLRLAGLDPGLASEVLQT
jgi:hypothetical protein